MAIGAAIVATAAAVDVAVTAAAVAEVSAAIVYAISVDQVHCTALAVHRFSSVK